MLHLWRNQLHGDLWFPLCFLGYLIKLYKFLIWDIFLELIFPWRLFIDVISHIEIIYHLRKWDEKFTLWIRTGVEENDHAVCWQFAWNAWGKLKTLPLVRRNISEPDTFLVEVRNITVCAKIRQPTKRHRQLFVLTYCLFSNLKWWACQNFESPYQKTRGLRRAMMQLKATFVPGVLGVEPATTMCSSAGDIQGLCRSLYWQ
jgi:hypothetical protein